MVDIINDKFIGLRLSKQPEFILRLQEFVDFYKLGTRSSLILQARPDSDAEKYVIDVGSADIRARFTAASKRDDGWWQGFDSDYRPNTTFHGIASVSETANPVWASEMHGDGHFIAGVWKFPESQSGTTTVLAVASFYSDCFLDFFERIARVTGIESPRYGVTATLLGADQLGFMKRTDFGGWAVSSPPLHTHVVQWPIGSAKPGDGSWTELAEKMARRLSAAYGSV